MGKGKEGWQTQQECIWIGHSSLTSWFLWKSFKRTRKVFPLKSPREGMVCPPAPSSHCQSCPRDYRLRPRPQSSDVHSEGLQCPHVPRGSHHKARLWATWCSPTALEDPSLSGSSWCSSNVSPQTTEKSYPALEAWDSGQANVRMAHIWI